MQLNLGEKIRFLRRRDGRTQEELANALGVTSQAVSRWEAGGCYPDINLIPSLANYFGITIDELFGYENQREFKNDRLASEIQRMLRQNNGVDHNLSACIATARNALVEFPGNQKLMLCLASALYTAGGVRYGEAHLIEEEGYGIYDVQTHRTYPEWTEAVSLYEKALQGLPNGALRNRAVDELSQLYLCLGEHEKCMALADSAPDLWGSREFLRPYACDGKSAVKARSETLLTALRACAIFIVNITTGDQKHLSAHEKAACIGSAIGLFATVCSDGNYGSHHGYIAAPEMLHSLYLWLDGRRDDAFGALERAPENEQKLLKVCEKGIARYSAPLVLLAEENAPCTVEEVISDILSMAEDWPWWSVPEAEQVKAEIQADPRRDAWVAKTRQSQLGNSNSVISSP